MSAVTKDFFLGGGALESICTDSFSANVEGFIFHGVNLLISSFMRHLQF